MPPDSFGLTMASLPTPTTTSVSSPDSTLAKRPVTSADTSTASGSNSSSDPLMAALQQTLSQLGYSMPAGSLTTSGTGASGGSSGSVGATGTTSSDATSTGAQFLAALYQALALQQSISASDGGASSGNSSANAIASFNDSASSGGGISAYRDLGSRIADLSSASRDSVDDTGNADDTAGEWDIEIDDVSETSEPDEADEEDPMDTAMSNLSDALQAHVAALDQDPGATVTLSDVLDGLSDSAGTLNWQPVGGMLDVSA
jgi:peptidoglycan hydrolase-like protein with peptidoglycan-binding domain